MIEKSTRMTHSRISTRALGALLLLNHAQALAPPPTSCHGAPNEQPIWTGPQTFVASVPNGQRYVAALAPNATTYNHTAPLTVLHVYGTAYEMGVAYGQLMGADLKKVYPDVLEYLYLQLNSSFDKLPPEVQKALEQGLEFALNFTYEATAPYTPVHWRQMLDGMATGSGMSFWDLARISMIPELTKAQCSMLGAWGAATANTSTPMVQLRALDWDTDGPFQRVPLLVTFHPNAGDGFAHTVLTWTGMVGAISGMSASGMALSEKVWDAYTGTQNIFGYPWHFVMQDILWYDLDMDSALSRIASANRTCSIWMGIGDSYNTEFKIVGYSYDAVEVFNPRNFPTYPNHDRFEDLIFINKHVQPSSEPCMNDIMHWLYGNIDAVSTLQYVTALEQTGDMHIAVYDFSNALMYVANASPGDGHGNNVTNAYDMPFQRFNMTELWNLAPPQL